MEEGSDVSWGGGLASAISAAKLGYGSIWLLVAVVEAVQGPVPSHITEKKAVPKHPFCRQQLPDFLNTAEGVWS